MDQVVVPSRFNGAADGTEAALSRQFLKMEAAPEAGSLTPGPGPGVGPAAAGAGQSAGGRVAARGVRASGGQGGAGRPAKGRGQAATEASQ